MSARALLIEAMVRAVIEDDDYWCEPEGTQNCREEQARALDALLANRGLLFEVLDWEQVVPNWRITIDNGWPHPVKDSCEDRICKPLVVRRVGTGGTA